MTSRAERLLARAREREGSFWARRLAAAEAWAATAGRPVVVRRALVLEEILRRIPAVVLDDELLVGTHPASPPPDPAPAGPALLPDIDALRSAEERTALRAGLFTSCIKTGHLTPDYPRLLAEGYGGILRRVEERRRGAAPGEAAQLEAMAIGLRAASTFAFRHADEADRRAGVETDPRRAAELRTVADACRRAAADPPRTLHGALQLLWFTFLVQCVEEGEGTAAFALGRFDRYLRPFWEADIAAGRSRDELVELLACFWIKLNEFRGLHVLNLTVGGSDAAGRDCVNDVSYACLELMAWLRSPIPSLSVRWHPAIDPAFLRRAVQLATLGIGQPAFYGDPAAKEAMARAGVAPADAADVVPGGCVELGIQGCCNPWVGNFFSLPKCLELALHDGVDVRTGTRVGPATGAPETLDTFEKLLAAYEAQVGRGMELMAASENLCDRVAAEYLPYPFLSAIVGDCVERGRDVTGGGARYNFIEDQGVGVGNVVDSLLNIRRLVYERGETDLCRLVSILDADFAGEEPLRRRLQVMPPSYGSGDPEVAAVTRRVVHGFYDAVERFSNPRGGPHRPGLLVWTLFREWADTVGALPDGRRRGEPLVSSIGPRAVVRTGSPTAVVLDATAFDHARCSGGLTLNLRFARSSVAGDAGLDALAGLLRAYFERGGLQIQINVVDGGALRAAQAAPDAHRDLVVRVSGFAARFVELDPLIQTEIIARHEL